MLNPWQIPESVAAGRKRVQETPKISRALTDGRTILPPCQIQSTHSKSPYSLYHERVVCVPCAEVTDGNDGEGVCGDGLAAVGEAPRVLSLGRATEGNAMQRKKSVYKHFNIRFLRTHSVPEKIPLKSSIPSSENPFLAE